MKLIVSAALSLALSACGKPCALICASDSDCLVNQYCLNRVACMDDCLRCNGQCATSLRDNCGACNRPCASNQYCSSSRASPTCVSACGGGETVCQGGCTDVTQDRFNCGGCGNTCARDQVCKAGACITLNTCS